MTITANGTHYFDIPQRSGRLVLMDICGAFAGASAIVGYKAADGAFTPYLKADGTTPVTLTARGGFTARVAREGMVGLQVSDVTGSTAIVLDVIPAVDMPPGS